MPSQLSLTAQSAKYLVNNQNTGVSPYTGPADASTVTAFLTSGGSGTSGIQTTPAIGGDGSIYFGTKAGIFYALTPALTLKWSYNSGAAINSSPALTQNGTVVFGNDAGVVVGLNVVDGSTVWTITFSQSAGSAGTGSDYGFRTAPAIGPDGTVYIGCNSHALYGITPGTGGGNATMKAAYYVSGISTSAITTAPALSPDGTVVYIAYLDGGNSNLLAINTTQTSNNQYNNVYWSNTGLPGIISQNLCLRSNLSVCFSVGKTLYAYGPPQSGNTGVRLWSYVNNSDPDPNSGNNNIFSTITLNRLGNVCFGDYGGYVSVIEPVIGPNGTGTLLWSYNTGGGAAVSGLITDSAGTVYAGATNNKVYAINPGTGGGSGSTKWTWQGPANGTGFQTPGAIGANGALYMTSYDNNIYAFGPVNGSVVCFLKGTMILTTRGEVPIEYLTAEDKIVSGGNIVDGKVSGRQSSADLKCVINFTEDNLHYFSRPICFKKDSMGTNVPNADLFVSPLHAVKVGNEMIQAHYLVNGKTIAYDMECDSAEYYHILLDNHSVIFANNMAAETLVPMDNSHSTDNKLTLENTAAIAVC